MDIPINSVKAETEVSGAMKGNNGNVIKISDMPTAIVVIGMAGSGKTTFVTSLMHYLSETCKKKVYSINLDPAVLSVPFKCNINIQDTIDYKEVMQRYKLGPNGAIMTSLNLFSTRFHKVMELLEKRAPKLDFIVIDTPGQMEVFNWSASGTIILDSLALRFPTVTAYVVDTPRCQRPVTFMSNMLYACSVLYKAKLPFIICFNKTDVVSHNQCVDWMNDYEAYHDAVMCDETYMASLSRSFALVMNEFYKGITAVGVSSATGTGLSEFYDSLQSCIEEYEREYLPWLELQRSAANKLNQKHLEQETRKFQRDYRRPTAKASAQVGSAASAVESHVEKVEINEHLTADMESDDTKALGNRISNLRFD